jgi:hypothetical protein
MIDGERATDNNIMLLIAAIKTVMIKIERGLKTQYDSGN